MVETPLLICCIEAVNDRSNKEKYMTIVQMLLEDDNSSIALGDENGLNALMYACLGGLPEFVRLLLRHKRCDIFVQDIDGLTCLHHLFKLHDIESVEKILGMFTECKQFSVCIGMLDKHDFSALDEFLRNAEIFRPEFKISQAGFRVLNALLAHDSVIKASKRTAATATTFCGSDVVKILVNAGIDFRGTLPDNESVFHCIANKDSFPKMNLVFTSCTKYTQVLKSKWQGMTPLEIAISNECNPTILEMMSQNVSWLTLKLIISSLKPSNLTFQSFVKRLGVRSWTFPRKHFIHSEEPEVLNHFFQEKKCDAPSDTIRVITEADTFAFTEKDTKSTIFKDALTEKGTKSTIFKDASKCNHINSVLIVKHCEYLRKIYGLHFKDVTECALKIANRISQEFRNKQNLAFMEFKPIISGSMVEQYEMLLSQRSGYCMFIYSY